MPDALKKKIGMANKKPPVAIFCKTCGVMFEVRKYRKNSALYCSRSCKSKGIYNPDKFTTKGKAPWNKGKNGFKHTEDAKKKISIAGTGRTHSEKTRRLLSIINTGKRHSEEVKSKLASYKGDKSANWRGGKSFEPYTSEWTKKLRENISDRDCYICQGCGTEYQSTTTKLHVHHIDYDKSNCSVDNLITLCISCHMKTNFNRDFWQERLSLLIAEFGRRVLCLTNN